MKRLYSFLYFIIAFVIILLTSLVNHFVNPKNFWYISLPLVLVFLCFSVFSMFVFSKETENIKKQNLILIILFPITFSLLQYPVLQYVSFVVNNRVFLSNCFLGLGTVFSMSAFSLSVKNVLGNISSCIPKFYKFIGICTYVMCIFASIQNCFQQSIQVTM